MRNLDPIYKKIEAADQYIVFSQDELHCTRMKTNKGITVTAYDTGTVMCQGPQGPALTALRVSLGLESHNDREPDPKATNEEPLWDQVVADMQERNQRGIATYGMPLQTSNGRNMLVDAYQENLDQAVYLKGAIEQRDLMVREIREIQEDFRPGDHYTWDSLKAWLEKWS